MTRRRIDQIPHSPARTTADAYQEAPMRVTPILTVVSCEDKGHCSSILTEPASRYIAGVTFALSEIQPWAVC